MPRSLPLLSWPLCLAFAAAVQAQEAPHRTDLARAYQRFEALREAAGPAAQERAAELERGFDQATLAYFSGQAGPAIAGLDRLSDSLAGGQLGLRASFAARLEPARWALGAARPQLRLAPLYRAQGAAQAAVLEVRPAGEARALLQVSLELRPGEALTPELAWEQLPVGDYRLVLSAAEGPALEVGRCAVLAEEVGATQAAWAARLEGASPPAAALAVWRERAKLYTASPDAGRTAESLADPVALRRELEQELSALVAGRDPYQARPGSYWRPIAHGKRQIPCRVVAPAEWAPDARLPLVVALHGAGGDENMFDWAYGRGALPRLATARGAVVVCPRTEVLLSDPSAFGALVETLQAAYPIDPQRIYLVAHSLGSVAAGRILPREGERIAAAVLFAGAAPKLERPPVRALRGALDPLGMGARGAEIVPDAGHTLLVGDRAAEALDWLWARRLPGPTWF